MGGFRNIIIFGGMKILWIYHNKIGLVLEVISIHFRDFRGFLKVNVQDGDIFLGSPKLQIIFGVWLIFPIYFGGRQWLLGPSLRMKKNMRVHNNV